MLYESAIKYITTQLDILEHEYYAKGWRIPFHSVSSMAEMFYQSDLKMQSIAEKMQLFNLIKEVHRFRLGGLEAVGWDFLVSMEVQTPTEKLR